MTLLRNWKARRPEGLEHKVCVFLFLFSRLPLSEEKSWKPTKDELSQQTQQKWQPNSLPPLLPPATYTEPWLEFLEAPLWTDHSGTQLGEWSPGCLSALPCLLSQAALWSV